MAIISDSAIRHNGTVFSAGTVITDSDMDKKSQKLLVDAGDAQYATVIKGEGNGSDDKKTGRLTVNEIAEQVAGINDVAELEALLEGEERKGAIDAINTRIAELKGNA